MSAQTQRAGKISLPPTFTSQHVASHLAGRRYGVPARMVAEATTRRLAGDWLGACAAARVDVRFDSSDLADRYGSATAALILDDLSHLAPDLVRWNLPRHTAGGTGELVPKLTVTLATYRRDGEPDLTLRVTTPDLINRPQRLALHLMSARPPTIKVRRRDFPNDWTTARHLWHDQHTHELRQWIGGGDRIPFHTADGRLLDPAEWPTHAPAGADPTALAEWAAVAWDHDQPAEAWAAAGVTADLTMPSKLENYPRWYGEHFASRLLVCSPTAVASALDLLAGEPGGDVGPVTISGSWRRFRLVAQQRDRVATVRIGVDDDSKLPALPWALCGRNVDLDLLRLGRINPMKLHPLVRSALLPGLHDDRYAPVRGDVVSQPTRVRCRGQWHSVGWRDNRLTALAHPPEEEQREAALRSLGGEVPGCFQVVQTWSDTALGGSAIESRDGRRRRTWLPKQLHEVRGHLLRAFAHGDADEVERLLATGIDPAGVRDHHGRTLLHMVACVDIPDLAPRLIAAGIPVNATDTHNRTPLHQVLLDAAPAALVRQLLDAGADVSATDMYEALPAHVIRSREAATIMPWLVAPGEKIPSTLWGRTPMMMALAVGAPAEVIAVLIEMGIDPTDTDDDYGLDLAEALEHWGRDDLLDVLRPYLPTGD